MWAADQGYERVVDALLQHGAELNLQGQDGADTSCHRRPRGCGRHADTARAEVNQQTIDGCTALIIAALFGRAAVVLRLLRR